LAETSHVAEVAAAVGLAEGERGVRSVLAALARLEPVSTRRLSRTVDLPVPIVASICGELRRLALVAEERPTRLTPLGRELYGRGALAVRRTATCPTCSGHGLAVTRELSALMRDMDRIGRMAPPARVELDQCHCTAETKLRRVLALHEMDALVGRRILLLGDDDLLSLAIRAVVRRLGSAATVAQLTVLDADPEVVRAARVGLSGAAFPYACVEHDLREPLPESLRGAFDTVVTDPPYTAEGAALFLSRAADALEGAGGDVLLSFGSRRPDVAFRVQLAITEMGFAVARLQRDFNEYVGGGALAGTSSLYQLRATEALRPRVTGSFAGPLYTAEVDA